jgi:capsule biosynthesis phosphatase
VRQFRSQGFYVILHTSRNMNTHGGNIGLINANTAPVLLEWLQRHDVPFDEIHFGKPWPGRGGFSVDDKAIRPSEFTTLSYEQILGLIGDE